MSANEKYAIFLEQVYQVIKNADFMTKYCNSCSSFSETHRRPWTRFDYESDGA